MTISELIERLSEARKRLGDVDVVYVADDQFADVTGVDCITKNNCPSELRWIYSSPVAVLELDKE